ncbi:MAG: VacJ family lipoprotein [Comamonadaceae bacterium]|nr:VacJ family lipoprotein [Pseudomonadota bacterium]MBS0611031.1 VacJ family lipoprotein [Pseudomonadota bacterium]MDE2416091.1 VacJ family lipoprotein [Comamonadaceae bacterium]
MTTETRPTTGAKRWAALFLGAALMAGCATGPNANPADPFEPYNRGMTTFNDNVDKAVLKPVATLYRDVTPSPVRTGVGNFFANLGDAWSFVNNLLQGRGLEAYESLVRFGTNTFLGLGGVLDIASEAGIERHKQDFGLTLGHWGVPTGPYLVLPLLGPSTVRDTAGLSADLFVGDLVGRVDEVAVRNSLYALRFVDTRASLLRTTTTLDEAALDPYSFTRDVYLKLRGRAAAGANDDQGGKLPEDY